VLSPMIPPIWRNHADNGTDVLIALMGPMS
jgi:hypothetical protein